MRLPEFNGQGVGPQGTGGIPPTEFRAGLEGPGAELVSSSIRPEDSAAVQEVMNREAQNLLAGFGTPPPPPQDTPQTPQAGPPEMQATPPQESQQPPTFPPGQAAPSSLEPRIEALKAKYGGDFGKLANAYSAARSEMGRAVTEKDTAIRAVQAVMGEVRELKEIVSSLVPRPGAEGVPQSWRTSPQPQFAPPPQGHPPQGYGTPQGGDFWNDPDRRLEAFKEDIADTVDERLQSHLKAFTMAQRQAQDAERLKAVAQSHDEEVRRLDPIMQDLFERNRDFYARSGMGQEGVFMDLLERARDRDLAMRGVQFYQETMAPGAENGAPAAGPTPGASPIMGSGQSHRPAGSAPPQGVAGTDNMKRLWNTRDGSYDETQAAMNVLKERGYGDQFR